MNRMTLTVLVTLVHAGPAWADTATFTSPAHSGWSGMIKPGSMGYQYTEAARDDSKRGFMSFNTASLPDGAVINSATLTGYCASQHSPGSPELYTVTHSIPLPSSAYSAAVTYVKAMPWVFEQNVSFSVPASTIKKNAATQYSYRHPGSADSSWYRRYSSWVLTVNYTPAVCGNGIVEGGEQCDGGACCSGCSFLGGGSACRGAAGPCDAVEYCTGSSASCPGDGRLAAGSVCRPVNGSCDVADVCDGSSVSCSADAYAAAGAICGPSGNCGNGFCSGTSPTCPPPYKPAGTPCRDSAGVCDVAETCTGSWGDCPTDGFAASGTVCRDSTGGCDRAETCTGSGSTCPGDGSWPPGTICEGGVCNAASSCAPEFLQVGGSLYPGQCRTSRNGRYQLCYQGDGHLTFKDGATTLWSRPEASATAGRATLFVNGSLVILNAGGTAVWESGDASTDLAGLPALQVLDTGDFVIDQQGNLDGMLEPPLPGPAPPPNNTCDIALHTRNAFGVPTTVHDVVKITRRNTTGTASTQLLNMQGGEIAGCNKVTCNKTATNDGCGSGEEPFHDTKKTWERTGLPHALCNACANVYLSNVGYDYQLADSNGAVNDCMRAIQAIDPTFKRPPLVSFLAWWNPSFRTGREYKFPWQDGMNPRQRCTDAIADLGCNGLDDGDCPMICGNETTHLCERCPSLDECDPTCQQDPTACGCPDEDGHDGSCGSVDDCGHVFGHPFDPGCEDPCQPYTSCAAQGATCGTIYDGCSYRICGTCGPGYDCTGQNQCSCVETSDQQCGWVTLCGQAVFLGDCDPSDCHDDYTNQHIDYCCSPSCGSHPNDVCEIDGTCSCVGTCEYPEDCGHDDGCGYSCWDCGPCGDWDGDCYDDCTWDQTCGGGGSFDCYDRPGCWMCGGQGGCAYEMGDSCTEY